jgi:hypothetical protein
MQFEALDRAMSIARPKASKLFAGGDGGILPPCKISQYKAINTLPPIWKPVNGCLKLLAAQH